ncbi:kinase-like domain-containing protein [Phlebopus sp. FC_14]|nr:kinase-like domain-containing protein [Phlebopus sp. FC_14]
MLGKRLYRELGIWKRLDHPNIVPFLGTVYGFGPYLSLVSPWMPNGTLQTFLAAHNDKLTIRQRFQLLKDVAAGLQYLHERSVIHGDVTGTNILIDDELRARLVDFGHSTIISDLTDGLAHLRWTSRQPGNIRWAAPEEVQQQLSDDNCAATGQSDIYSFGCIMLQVLSGNEPWSEIKADMAVVLRLANGENPQRPMSRRIDDEHWAVIQKCWLPVGDRLSAEQVLGELDSILTSLPSSSSFGVRSQDAPSRGRSQCIGHNVRSRSHSPSRPAKRVKIEVSHASQLTCSSHSPPSPRLRSRRASKQVTKRRPRPEQWRPDARSIAYDDIGVSDDSLGLSRFTFSISSNAEGRHLTTHPMLGSAWFAFHSQCRSTLKQRCSSSSARDSLAILTCGGPDLSLRHHHHSP